MGESRPAGRRAGRGGGCCRRAIRPNVIVLEGSAGWEAILLRRPCVVLAVKPFYAKCPLAFPVANICDMNVVLPQAVGAETLYEDRHAEWLWFIDCVLRTAPPGVLETYEFPHKFPANSENLGLMVEIDRQFLETPFYGARQMTWHLRAAGHPVNIKRVRRLMRLMGLMPIYRQPRTSILAKGHKLYPYLLRGIRIDRPNQVWCADITYIPLAKGFLYLVAIMDWWSRKVLAWRLSNTMDV